MKRLVFVLIAALSFNVLAPQKSHAQSKTSNGLEVCYTGMALSSTAHRKNARMLNMDFKTYMDMQNYKMYQAMELQCKDVSAIQVGIASTVLTLSIVSAGTALTIGGTPVTVGIGFANAVLGYMSFVIGKMDCKEDEEVLKAKVKDAVCEVLTAQGLQCDPTKIQDGKKEPAPMCSAEKFYL